MAVPVGVGTAIYLAEYAPTKISRAISMLVDLLAAIPSVVLGFIGLVTMLRASARVPR